MTISVCHKWAILWGGGLGDLLVIRPLLQVFAEANFRAPLYVTTASHLPHLFGELKLHLKLVQLPRAPLKAVRHLRTMGQFDWVYCGPKNTWRTRLLARSLRSRYVWRSDTGSNKGFLGDAIVRDIRKMGITKSVPAPYGSLPLFHQPECRSLILTQEPYIVLHPGAKANWQTKQWPTERWRSLISILVRQGWQIHVVGTASEREFLSRLMSKAAVGKSVIVHTGLKLWELEKLVAHAAGVVCHNSGVMHMAVAHRKRTLVLTGSSGRQWRAPYEWVLNISSGACNLACNRYRCPIPGFRAKCIRELTLERVLNAFESHIIA